MSTSMSHPLRVAALPFVSPPGCIAGHLTQAARDGVSLAVFPELGLVGAVGLERLRRAELESLSEPLGGASIGAVTQAVEATGVAAGVGWLERGDDGALYNSYVVCVPGGARYRHRKVYATENPHLQAGDRFDVHETPWGMTMSILIGADSYFPENARVAALKGATLLVAPHRSCFGTAADRSTQREWMMRTLSARAGDNGMFAVLSDVQEERKGERRPGGAWIADPSGRMLAAAEPSQSLIAAADLDRDRALHSVARRWLAVRRPELYSALIASEAHEGGGALDRSPNAARPTGKASGCGSVAVSFAMVGRKRAAL